MPSSLAVVIDGLSLSEIRFEGLERGDPNDLTAAVFSRVCQIPGPSRSVCLLGPEGGRVGEGSLRALRDRGAGGKGRATDLRTGRGPVALGVLPLVPSLLSLLFPATPCSTPAPLQGLCHTFPCSSALSVATSRKVPAATAAAQARVGGGRAGKEGGIGMHCNFPFARCQGLSLCILGEETKWRFVCAKKLAIFHSRLTSFAALLPTYICNRYVPGSPVSQSVSIPQPSSVFNRQSSILCYIVVISFAPSPRRHTLSRPASLPVCQQSSFLLTPSQRQVEQQ